MSKLLTLEEWIERANEDFKILDENVSYLKSKIEELEEENQKLKTLIAQVSTGSVAIISADRLR